ncbi:E3 ubiquitin ligase BIG BROTHER-related-like [Impatiens glandulifera]|uniref:E3 ubiquitin ligase BIG BROTHER-related-like n=1 Tax=Impatiens glandulifera TaxID=253017 RepID=UPI001FB0CE99|nr:E3 ubiquitin ligase BIG BROTHER-related-like [Impatiens glandulifera]
MEPKSGNDEEHAKIGNGYATATTTAAAATATDDNKPVNDFSGEVVPAVGSPSDVAAVNGTCRSSRTPFTNLSQVDADLALARTLQEQERAYMMLSTGGDGVAYRGWADYGFSYDEDHDDDDDDDDDDDFDHHTEDYIGTDAEVEAEDYAVGDVLAHAEDDDEDEDAEYDIENDEEYARAIQDIEDQDVAARLLSLAGLNDEVVEDIDEQDDDDDNNAQGMWDDVDPDELSYEELLALGEVVGTESRGLSADVIASLPSFSYKTAKNADASCDPCVICRLEYEEDDTLTALSCKHSYHSECINNWLNINKICPVCSTEVSTSGNS